MVQGRMKGKKSRKKFQGQELSEQRLRGREAQGLLKKQQASGLGMLLRGQRVGKRLLGCEVSIYYVLDTALNASGQPI